MSSFIPFPIGRRLKDLRKERELSLIELSQKAGLNFRRLSEIERGERNPLREQLERLAKYLMRTFDGLVGGTDWVPPEELKRQRDAFRKLAKELKVPYRYLAPPGKMHSRHEAALREFAETTERLTRQVDARPDADEVRRLLAHLSCDSGPELVWMLWLLAMGGRPIRGSTREVGFRAHAVLRGETWEDVADCEIPGLALEIGGLKCALFFQVWIATAKGLRRLDGLGVVGRGAAVHAVDFEVDGPGHRARKDEGRQTGIRMKAVRITVNDLVSADFPDRFEYLVLKAIGAFG